VGIADEDVVLEPRDCTHFTPILREAGRAGQAPARRA
jgi:hypothetical protein